MKTESWVPSRAVQLTVGSSRLAPGAVELSGKKATTHKEN
jgi:hypothetical protein